MSNEQTPQRASDVVIDIDAFCPTKTRQVKIDGKVYTVPEIADIPSDDYDQLLTIEDRTDSMKERDALAEYVRCIKLIIPDFDGRKTSIRKLATMITVLRSVSVKENPTGAEENKASQ